MDRKLKNAIKIIIQGPVLHTGCLYTINYDRLDKDYLAECHSELQITEMKPTDEEGICELRNIEVWKALNDMQKNGHFCVVAKWNGEVVGHLACAIPPKKDDFFYVRDSAFFKYAYVAPKARGKGIQPAMNVVIIEELHKKYGINSFLAAVDETNNASQRGIQKVGFRYLEDYRCYSWWRWKWRKKI